jgi:hypothetical protein
MDAVVEAPHCQVREVLEQAQHLQQQTHTPTGLCEHTYAMRSSGLDCNPMCMVLHPSPPQPTHCLQTLLTSCLV